MVAVVQLTLAVDENAVDVADALITRSQPDERAFLRLLSRKLDACAGGVRGVKYAARVDDMDPDGMDAVEVTNTITKSSLVADTDKLTIGTVTFEWVASASAVGEVTIGSDDAACATNLAAAINGQDALGGLFSAEASSGVVTISYHGDPRAGVFIALSEAGSGQALSASSFASMESLAAKSASDVITGSLGLA